MHRRHEENLWDDVGGGKGGGGAGGGGGGSGGDFCLEDMAESTLKFHAEREAFMAQAQAEEGAANGTGTATGQEAPEDDQNNDETFGAGAAGPDDGGLGGIGGLSVRGNGRALGRVDSIQIPSPPNGD
jgi:hypothetical protein